MKLIAKDRSQWLEIAEGEPIPDEYTDQIPTSGQQSWDEEKQCWCIPQSSIDNQCKELVKQTLMNRLNSVAQEKDYDNAMSVRSYTGFANTFQIEATKYSDWCAECWQAVASLQLENRSECITEEEILSVLPEFSWD